MPDTILPKPDTVQALLTLREQLDGPLAVLVADLIEAHLARVAPGKIYDRLDAMEVFGRLRGAAEMLRACVVRHRASPFAMDRLGNSAQIAQLQFEVWDSYREKQGEKGLGLTEYELTEWAECHGRLQALVGLKQIYQSGKADPLVAEGDWPPTRDVRTPDILDESKRHVEDRLQAEFDAQGAEQREQEAKS